MATIWMLVYMRVVILEEKVGLEENLGKGKSRQWSEVCLSGQ